MEWIDSSILGSNAVAKGQPGAKHRLSEEDQGDFHYVEELIEYSK